MKLLPIINNNHTNVQTFRGLWGKIEANGAAHEFGSTVSESFFYHPFADESEAEISAAVSSKTDSWTCEAPGYTSSYYSTVHVMDKLPFTKQEYMSYKALKGKEDVEFAQVEKGLGSTRLYKFINNKPRFFLKKFISLFKR